MPRSRCARPLKMFNYGKHTRDFGDRVVGRRFSRAIPRTAWPASHTGVNPRYGWTVGVGAATIGLVQQSTSKWIRPTRTGRSECRCCCSGRRAGRRRARKTVEETRMKFTSMKSRIDKLFEQVEPRRNTIRITGGLPDDALSADTSGRAEASDCAANSASSEASGKA